MNFHAIHNDRQPKSKGAFTRQSGNLRLDHQIIERLWIELFSARHWLSERFEQMTIFDLPRHVNGPHWVTSGRWRAARMGQYWPRTEVAAPESRQ